MSSHLKQRHLFPWQVPVTTGFVGPLGKASYAMPVERRPRFYIAPTSVGLAITPGLCAMATHTDGIPHNNNFMTGTVAAFNRSTAAQLAKLYPLYQTGWAAARIAHSLYTLAELQTLWAGTVPGVGSSLYDLVRTTIFPGNPLTGATDFNFSATQQWNCSLRFLEMRLKNMQPNEYLRVVLPRPTMMAGASAPGTCWSSLNLLPFVVGYPVDASGYPLKQAAGFPLFVRRGLPGDHQNEYSGIGANEARYLLTSTTYADVTNVFGSDDENDTGLEVGVLGPPSGTYTRLDGTPAVMDGYALIAGTGLVTETYNAGAGGELNFLTVEGVNVSPARQLSGSADLLAPVQHHVEFGQVYTPEVNSTPTVNPVGSWEGYATFV